MNATNSDFLTESLMSEGCVATLYNCMKNLEEEIKTVLQMCERTKESQIRDKSHLKSLSESLENIATNLTNRNITRASQKG